MKQANFIDTTAGKHSQTGHANSLPQSQVHRSGAAKAAWHFRSCPPILQQEAGPNWLMKKRAETLPFVWQDKVSIALVVLHCKAGHGSAPACSGAIGGCRYPVPKRR